MKNNLPIVGALTLAVGLIGSWVLVHKKNNFSDDNMMQLSSNEAKKEEETEYEKILRERELAKPLPKIDPSLCTNNPEGYLYFRVGREVFHFTKDSAIQVGVVFPDNLRSKKIKIEGDIPEGCKENPFTDVSLNFNYAEAENIIGNFKLGLFKLIPVADEFINSPSMGQASKEKYFYYLKEKENICEKVSSDVTKCGFKNIEPDNSVNKIDGQYMSDASIYSTFFNRPYVLDCHGYVSGIKCDSFYRLYPSVDIQYEYFPGKNFDNSKILLLDKYIRMVFESMRVTN